MGRGNLTREEGEREIEAEKGRDRSREGERGKSGMCADRRGILHYSHVPTMLTMLAIVTNSVQ